MFSVRIVVSDHYMTNPIPGLDVAYSSFRGSIARKVPVIRIFGTNNDGEKTLLHVHGVFPYVYVPCDSVEPDPGFPYRLASALDHALNVSMGQTSSAVQHVFKIIPVAGIPFYGYHDRPHQFYKVYLYSPTMVKRAAELLQNGVVLNTVYQVHDAHIPYILKFFIDYNLRGMDVIRLGAVRHRRASDADVEQQPFLLEDVAQVGIAPVEVDAVAEDILNRHTMSLEMNPGLVDIWEVERQRRRGEGISSQITPQASQERPGFRPTDSEVFLKRLLAERLHMLSSKNEPSLDTTLQTPSSVPYPAETPEHASLLEASYIEPHVSSRSTSQHDSSTMSPQHHSQSPSMDESVVMDSQDLLLADILESMEEESGGGATADDGFPLAGSQVDDDSVLGTQAQQWPEEDDDLVLNGTQMGDNFVLAGRQVDDDSILGTQLQRWPEDDENVLLAGRQAYDGQVGQSSDKPRGDDEEMWNDPLSQLDGAISSPEHLKESPSPLERNFDDSSANEMVQPGSNGCNRRNTCNCSCGVKVATIPAVDGGLDSDESSDECPSSSSTPPTPKRRKGSYRPLDVKFEKSPKSSKGERGAGQGETSRAPRRGVYGALDVKCDTSPRRNRLFLNFPAVRLKSGVPSTSEMQPTSTPPSWDLTVANQDKAQCPVKNMIASRSGLDSQNVCDFGRSPKLELGERGTNCDKLVNTNNVAVEVTKISTDQKRSLLQIKNKSQKKSVISKVTPISGESIPYRRISVDLFADSNSPVTVSSATESVTSSNTGDEKGTVVQREETCGHEQNATPEERKSVETCELKCVKEIITIKKENKTVIDCEDQYEHDTKSAVKERCKTVDVYEVEGAQELNLVNDNKHELSGLPKNALTDDKCNPKFELLSDDDLEDLGIVSFYDNTHIFSDLETSISSSNDCPPRNETCVIVPAGMPPTRTKVIESLSRYGIPEHRFQEPFYGDPSDVTEPIEVGNRRVALLGDSIDSMPAFRSSLPDVVGLDAWREERVAELGVGKQLSKMRSSLASAREVTLVPCFEPPTYAEVDTWQKARMLLKKQAEDGNLVLDGSLQGSLTSVSGSESVYTATPSPEAPESPLAGPSDAVPWSARCLRNPASPESPVTGLCSGISSTPLSSKIPSEVAAGHQGQGRCKKGLFSTRRTSTSPDRGDGPASRTRKTRKKKKSSQASNEDQSLHKLLLQSQFRQQLASPWRAGSSGCQIEGVHNNTYGFGMSLENLQDVKSMTHYQYLTIMSMELHTQTRGDLRPDPASDPIRAVFYVVTNDVPPDHSLPKQEEGMIIVGDQSDGHLRHTGWSSVSPCYVPDELALLDGLASLLRSRDPDVLAGYETEMLSWGYLVQRASALHVNVCSTMSRVPSGTTAAQRQQDVEDDGADLHVTGRVVLNGWRLMKGEIALMNYTFENVAYHVLHRRVALHSFRTLSRWWEHPTRHYRALTVGHYMERVHGIVQLMDQLDLVGRTSELARLFGIQFYEVLSRGSQFRVESMMLRLAKPLNYVPVSPSIRQRAKMRAPESLPLILEPESRFYADPVIVLDFQSLYPSIIIAYNYCFSTCLGRVEHLGKNGDPFTFGCTRLRVPPRLLASLGEDRLNVAPCGVAFVREGVRVGVLPRMLTEILATRLMVKRAMKRDPDNKTLQRVLHARQLGLKLIANVTYGYTAANFSGRMPCSEVADSVVSKGRETLQRAIQLVGSTERWGARVVYGDTDSLFVLVEGRSREQAFAIGAEIAEAVTNDNPKPVKLKLEKVYQPCILQTKKRYVGYMYESPDQAEPSYDAKGIETVRRDGCPAVAKILEKCLRLVFETSDVSLVKRYVRRQLEKVLRGRANVQDLIFAREYRGMAGYKPGACVPALELTRQWVRTDKRAEPRAGERVPYVIVNGPPGMPLIRLVRSPHELMADLSLSINATYYITGAILPPLARCFSLLGADVHAWYADMPRKLCTYLPTEVPTGQKKSTISQYFVTMNCAVCGSLTNTGLCAACHDQPQRTTLVLCDKLRSWERSHGQITKICQSCCGRPHAIECKSLDCPILFRKYQAWRDLEQAPFVRGLLDRYTF